MKLNFGLGGGKQPQPRQRQEAQMLGDPLPYPGKGHRTNIQQGLEGHAAPSPTIMVLVKAKEGAVVYQDFDIPVPVPEDSFVPVALSPTIVQAVKDGDLEQQGKPFLDVDEEDKARHAASPPTPRARHARTTHTTE